MAAEPAVQRCVVCKHPDREEIEAALRDGVSMAAIMRWTVRHTSQPLRATSLINHRDRHLADDRG